ncbi:MAG: DUF92 domain-containing protein [Clostridia bacterium]|nr:DUF92 domain-containing protein [Clostridia bacterium]
MIVLGYLLGIAYALLCLGAALLLYKLGLPKKYTRKLVHILVGFEWIILYYTMGPGVHFLAVCLFFLLLLSVSYFKNLMPMISSDADNAPGTVYYAVAMSGVAALGCFLPSVMLPFGVGIFCTSIGDGVAGVVGQALSGRSPKIYGNKTLAGTVANFASSSLSALVMSLFTPIDLSLLECMLIGIFSAGIELVVGFGLDNIVITWSVTALTYAFMYFDAISSYIVPIILTPIIIAVVLEKRALTPLGTATAVVLDALVSVSLGNAGFVILCSFLFGSVIIDKFKKRKKTHGRIEETAKGDCRDAIQVLANGAVPTALSVAFAICGSPILLAAYVAALAEAFADTAASGLGAFARRVVDPFRMKRCENGISGGMSLIGTLSALVGAFLFAALGLAFSFYDLSVMFLVGTFAFLGTVLDSLLGSLVQVKYRCDVCGRVTERRLHCGTETRKFSGIAFVNNDLVNFLSGAFAALLALLFA